MDAALQDAPTDAQAAAAQATMRLLAQKEAQLQFYTANFIATLRDLGITPMHVAVSGRVQRLDGKGHSTIATAAYAPEIHSTELDEYILQATRQRELLEAEQLQEERPGDFLYVGSLRKQHSRVLA